VPESPSSPGEVQFKVIESEVGFEAERLAMAEGEIMPPPDSTF